MLQRRFMVYFYQIKRTIKNIIMSLVGKSSGIAVDAISEMGDNLKINILKKL
jgi:hypothetical protein